MTDYYERLNRIILQQARANFSTPVLMRYQGEGGAYQVMELKAADLGSTREVRVRKGTFSLLAPTAKAQLIQNELLAGMITPDEALRLKRENMSALIGLEENPHVERVKSQLWLWRQGPTEEQKALGEQYQQMLPELQMQMEAQMAELAAQPPQVDPATGQPIPPEQPQLPPDPLMEAAMAIFKPLPVDDEPNVAQIRHQEISREVAQSELHGFPQGWVDGLSNVYLATRQAAGIQSLAEQAAAQQAAAQQQAAQQQAQFDQQKGQADESHSQQMRQGDEKHQQAMQQKMEQSALKAQTQGSRA
jgi:hypothetical protein